MGFQNISVNLSTNVAAFRGQMAAAAHSVRGFQTEVTRSSADTARASRSAVASFDAVERKTLGLSGAVGGLRGALGGLGVAAAAMQIGRIVGDLETTRTAFEGLLGSAEEADGFIREMQSFAAVTPFEFAGVAKASQQFLALGASTDEALARISVIGGALATTGNVSEEAVSRVVRALSQIESRGRLAAEELNQLSDVLPTVQRTAVFDALAAKMGTTRAEVQKLAEQGLIPADVALEAIYATMLRLPGATDAMARQSETLMGRLSTLRDTARQAVGEGFGPLAASAGDLLAVTTPLVEALGGLLGAITSNAAAVDIMEGLVVVFAAMKVAPLVTSVLAFGQALTVAATQAAYAAAAMGTASVAATTLSAAAIRLQAALGPVGLALAGLAGAYAILKPAATDAEEATVDFTAALMAAGEEADRAVTKLLAAELAKNGVVDDFAAAGISLGAVKNGIMAMAEGTQEGAARFYALQGAITAAHAAGLISEGQLNVMLGTVNDLAWSVDVGTKKAEALTAAEKALGIAGSGAAAGQNELAEALGKVFNPASAMAKYQGSLKAAEQGATGAAIDAIRARFDARRRGLDDEERLERDAYERQAQTRRQALDEQLDAEQEAIDEEHDLRLQAIEDRFDAERDALDAQREAEEGSLRVRHRAEQQALDARLQLLKQATDKRKRLLERHHDEERDEVQWMIDNTFGAEREAWKARLDEIEESHEDRLDEIDNELDAETTALENQLDDQQRAEKDSLDDRFDYLLDILGRRKTAEANAETDRFEAAKDAFDARALQQKTALDNEVTDHKAHLGQKFDDLKANLKDQEEAASAAEETRRKNAQTAQGLALADYQGFLDAELAAADRFTRDLAIIASRGGHDVMDQIRQMDPAEVAAAAAAGPAAFTRWLDSIRALLAVGKPGTPNPGPGGWLNGVRLGADGHLNRRAMTASSPILWAEAGPEAYIPLSSSKRSSSLPILAQSAAAFGYSITPMAGGGIIGGAHTTVDNRMTNTFDVRVTVAAGVDPGAVGRAVRREVEAALDKVGRQATMRHGGRS